MILKSKNIFIHIFNYKNIFNNIGIKAISPGFSISNIFTFHKFIDDSSSLHCSFLIKLIDVIFFKSNPQHCGFNELQTIQIDQYLYYRKCDRQLFV